MTKTTKITQKERYNQIIAILAGVDGADELIDFCEDKIAQIDKKADKAKENAANKKAEADPMAVAVSAALTADFDTIANIAARVDYADATEAKVRYRLNALVEAGAAEKTQITVPGTDGAKARKLQAYRAV